MLNLFKPLIGLLFPDLCISCSHHEPVHEGILCHYCWEELPRYEDLNNKVLLQNKFPLIPVDRTSFYGLFLYSKGTHVQNILHDIKYYGKPYKAVELGKWLGQKVKDQEYDALIPIPIHIKKRHKRGYNQAEKLAKGMSSTSEIKIINDSLKKIMDTGSQTHLTRAQRLLNVAKAYQKGKKLPPNVKKVLLVDDVVTTGATLEVCTQLLQKDQEVQVDYAFIAMAV